MTQDSVCVRVSTAAACEDGDDFTRRREALLIQRIKAGDSELFYELVQPYQRHVYLTALAIVGNPADAEDVAQDAVVKAFSKLSQFRGEARFSTWLIRITVNAAKGMLRRSRIVRFEPLEITTDDGDIKVVEMEDWREIPSEALDRSELRQMLGKALRGLRPRLRQISVLRDILQLSVSETASVLGITPANVKVRLLRARLAMRDALASYCKHGRAVLGHDDAGDFQPLELVCR